MFKSMKLGGKLYSGFAFILAFTVFIGVFAIINMQNISGEMSALAVTMMVIVGLDLILGIFIAISVKRSITSILNEYTEKIRQGGEQIVAASSQLSSASEQLAEANTEQAASLQEISATVDETTSMIQQNSANTKQADILAQQAKSTADICNEDMSEMISAMDEIKKSSDKIAGIIKVIDEIAFQTNILALNAAVEAARAGDVGMGFAVVAEEVRNLAQRSAQAAKDTETMIANNIALSGKGVEVADKVAGAISEITEQVKKVSELMDEITAAGQEQAQGMIQIDKAITQLNTVTESNAAIAEESAASSGELFAQAESTEEIVDELFMLIHGNKNNVSSSGSNSRYTQNSAKSFGGKPKPGKKSSRSKDYSPSPKFRNPSEIIPLEEADAGF